MDIKSKQTPMVPTFFMSRTL